VQEVSLPVVELPAMSGIRKVRIRQVEVADNPRFEDLGMSAYYSRFHDGFLDGFLVGDPHVIIFLRTDGDEAFTLGL
jgi:hypothetical protein